MFSDKVGNRNRTRTSESCPKDPSLSTDFTLKITDLMYNYVYQASSQRTSPHRANKILEVVTRAAAKRSVISLIIQGDPKLTSILPEKCFCIWGLHPAVLLLLQCSVYKKSKRESSVVSLSEVSSVESSTFPKQTKLVIKTKPFHVCGEKKRSSHGTSGESTSWGANR